MWLIAALLVILFALFVFSRIAKTLKMYHVFGLLAAAVLSVVAFLTLGDIYAWYAIMGFLIISHAVFDLIAIPILRRRVMHPCVHVKILLSGIYRIIKSIALFFVIALFVFFLLTESLERLRSSGMILLLGPATVASIIFLILILFEKIEICGNGLWQFNRLLPWEEYESFSWEWKTESHVELKLVSRTWGWSTRLIVLPEDREAVQQLLEANLPDLSATKMKFMKETTYR